MRNVWTMKMEQFTTFSEEERQQLDELISRKHVHLGAREDILKEGEHSDHCNLMLSGLACRYKILPDGKRQIMAFLVPGDLCDAEIFVLKEMDHSIGTLTPSTTAVIHADEMKALLRRPGSLSEAVWWGTLTDLGVLRERIIDHGSRDAYVRTAHLLYEMLVRYRVVGETIDDGFDFPITQEELADATGMTPVHANRTLQRLREEGLISLKGKRLIVLDAPRLKKVAQFNANYLHLDRVHDVAGGIAGRAGDLV
jgi:CRP-like cAMP-binding protein